MLAAFQLSEPFALYRLLVGRQPTDAAASVKAAQRAKDDAGDNAQHEQNRKPDRNNDDDRSGKVHHRSNRSGAH